MKYFFISVSLLIAFVTSASAQQKAEDLARRFNQAFARKALSSLDKGRPVKNRIAVTIEHSISEDRPRTRTFASFSQIERWLKSQQREDGTPLRNITKLSSCRSGVCRYNVGSLLHNNIYIKRVSYAFVNGKPYIRSVLILDGD